MALPVNDGPAALNVLWVLCVEWYASEGQAPGQIEAWLDERWRWGTLENPDEVIAMDATIPASSEERQAAASLLALAGGLPE